MRRFILPLFILLSLLGTAQSDVSDARDAYFSGDYEACISLTTALIDVERNAEAYLLRAQAFHKQGKFAQALADYDYAEKRGSADEELYLNRGICRSSLQLYDAATKDLWRFLELSPDHALAYYYLGEVDFMLGNTEAALEFIGHSLELDDDYMPAWYLQGAAFAEKGKWRKARESFDRAAQIDPSFRRIQLNIALTCIEQMEFDEANEILSNLLLEDDTLLPEVYYYRAEVKYFQKDHVGACEDWKQSADLGDEDAATNWERVCQKGKDSIKQKRRTYAEF
ncbi:MAG: tetratricopeptide repeat protein [Flavobacteriales bacterium]|nr:tetratricopeptide repeat protein [Flavobacteriales bacterium]